MNFLALLGMAIALRGWQLGTVPGLNGDEAWLGVQAAHLAAGEPIAWRTPTGNPVNLCLLLPVAALHLVFGPSVAVLRMMALVSGVAALGANFWLCRRIFDRRSALVSTTVLAVLPIAIAYSRFAWDASQTLLATVLVLYFALSNVDREVGRGAGKLGKNKNRLPANPVPPDWLPALVAFGIAIWIHPTNIFALWLLIVPAAYRSGDDCRAAIRGAWQRSGGLAGEGLLHRLTRGITLATLGIALVAVAWFCRRLLMAAALRSVNPEQAGLFMRRLVQLLSGTTVFEFIPGPARTSTGLAMIDVALVSLVGVAALGLTRRLRRADSARERCLAWSVALMVGTFYLVAGPEALAPHFERYGMCLVAPIGVLLALGWSHWLGSRGFDQASLVPHNDGSRRTLRARLAAVVLAVAAWLWLAVFCCDYFLVFRTSGGTSHMAFRTAAIEPKLAALKTIVAAERDADSSAANEATKQIWIVADSWWSYWPLAYFAAGRPEIHVVAEEQWPAASQQVAGGDAVWRVNFVTADAAQLPAAPDVGKDRGASAIRDYSGAPLLTVERLRAPVVRPAATGD